MWNGLGVMGSCSIEPMHRTSFFFIRETLKVMAPKLASLINFSSSVPPEGCRLGNLAPIWSFQLAPIMVYVVVAIVKIHNICLIW
jgi:hypothetical protein